MIKNKIWIIILNYNCSSDTIKCLQSINKLKKKSYDLHTLIVDNASTDDSITKINAQFPGLNLLQSPANKGYASGNNLGLKHVLKQGADYILILNPDTIITDPCMITKLIKTKVDITSPTISSKKDGQITYDYGGKIDPFLGRNTHIESRSNKLHASTPDYLSGVCLFVKKKVFKKNGLFDENYFLYYEDVDFCQRAKQNGFIIKPTRTTSLRHHLSSSTNKLGKRKLSILAKSQLYFAKNHLPKPSTPFYYLYHLYLKIKSKI